MNIVSREECIEHSTGFAPFDLTKTLKFDRKTEKVELAVRTYDLANIYFSAARVLLDKSIEYMPVVLTNISFACELYLKALLYGYNTDLSNIHGLKDLFEKLPEDIQSYIANNIAIENREYEFPLCLAEQNTAFVTYRYMNEAKRIAAHPIFLFAFAHILQFVYETLTEESNEIIESGDIE